MRARPETLRPWCFALAVVVLAAMSTAAVLLPSSHDGVAFGGPDQIAIAGIGVLLAVLAWRPTCPRLVADERGVRVKGPFGDYRFVPWELVRSVEFRPKWRWARLVLAADETVSLYAVQRIDGARAVQTMRALRELHAAASRSPAE